MRVSFVLGKPSSNRESVLVEKIKAAVAGDVLRPILVIVPPQATYSVECMLMDRLGADGFMGINVASIARIQSRVLQEVHGAAEQAISDSGKSILIKCILDQKKDLLSSFGKLRQNASLPLLISNVITELKQTGISADSLEALDDTAMAKGKFRDIAFIYRELENSMQGYIDTEDRLTTVTRYIKEANFISEAHVFIHGFDMYNAQTVQFISEIMRTAKHTTMSFLYSEPNLPGHAVYGICDENRMRFYSTAKELGLEEIIVTDDANISPDILHIRDNLFTDGLVKRDEAKAVSISTACDMREEVDGVAAQIAFLVTSKACDFSDIAVVCGNSQSYLGIIKNRFAMAAIPCYTGEKRSLLQSTLADFILGAFELSRGRLKKNSILKHAATGFCKISELDSAKLKNYAFEKIRDGFAFLKKFEKQDYKKDITDAKTEHDEKNSLEEDARQKLMMPIEELRKNAAKAVLAKDAVTCVLAYLEELGLRSSVEKMAGDMRRAELYEGADYLEQAYKRIMALLEQLSGLSGLKSSGAALARLIKAGMAAEQISIIPPATSEVLCGDIAGTYLPGVKILFVMGMNEGSIPNYSRTPDVLTEQERELILGELAGLKHTGSIDKQKLIVAKALSRPSKRLYLSYVDSVSEKPSPLIDRIDAMFGKMRKNKLASFVPMLENNAIELAVRAMRSAADGQKSTQIPAEVAAVLGNKQYSAERQKIRSAIERKNIAVNIGENTGIYDNRAYSATRVESYFSCPYKHFMRYGIKALVPREYTVGRIDVGNYAHDIFDLVVKRANAEKLDWKEIKKETLFVILDDCAVEVRKKQAKYTLNKHNEAVLKEAERDIKLTAEMILEQCCAGSFVPGLTEQKFEIKELGLTGKIDRVDIAELDGKKYFSLVDYKTGNEDIKIANVLAGIDLQLILYIMGVQTLLEQGHYFAGANYMHVYSAMLEVGESMIKQYRMNGIVGVSSDLTMKLYGDVDENQMFSINCKVKKDGEYYADSEERYMPSVQLNIVLKYVENLIAKAQKSIGEGENSIVPTQGQNKAMPCIYCDFAGVCMFDSEDNRMQVRKVVSVKKADAIKKMENKL